MKVKLTFFCLIQYSIIDEASKGEPKRINIVSVINVTIPSNNYLMKFIVFILNMMMISM